MPEGLLYIRCVSWRDKINRGNIDLTAVKVIEEVKEEEEYITPPPEKKIYKTKSEVKDSEIKVLKY